MKDIFGVELLPIEFSGIGVDKDCKFKQLEKVFDKYLYVVTDEWDNFHFEVISCNLKKAPIFKDYHQIYPSDELLDINKWRFYDHEEALNFFNNLDA